MILTSPLRIKLKHCGLCINCKKGKSVRRYRDEQVELLGIKRSNIKSNFDLVFTVPLDKAKATDAR